MSGEHLRRYASSGYRKVDGWLGPDSISQIVELDRVQRALGIRGHVGEIGVHHGKLFILLYLLARDEECALAVDLFEQQELNVDRSGEGSRHALQRNLLAHAGDTSRLRLISADSTTIGAAELRAAAGGRLRLLSIDGGHLARIVRHDLESAASSLCEGGVVILDDYFNPEFPGVSEGVNRFFLMDDRRGLVPFFVAMNKVYLTTASHARHYLDHFTRRDLGMPYEMMAKFGEYRIAASPIRVTEMFGADVLSYSPDRFSRAFRIRKAFRRMSLGARSRVGKSSAWRRLRDTGLGQLVRRVVNRLVPY